LKGRDLFLCQQRKNSKTLRDKRMAGPVLCARFFDFFAFPKKASPHRCGPPWAAKVRTREVTAILLGRHSPRKVKSRTASAGLRRGCATASLRQSPTAAIKGAHPSARLFLASRPPTTPRHLGLHVFCCCLYQSLCRCQRLQHQPPFFF
jgi:hypothetical protein